MRGGNRPIMLYNLPELYNKEHCLCYVDEREIDVCAEETTPKLDIPCDETVRDLCMLLMEMDMEFQRMQRMREISICTFGTQY